MNVIGCAVVSLLPSPRLLYALAQDGMLFRVFSRVSKRTGVPVIGTLSCGLFIGETIIIILFSYV